MSYRQSSAGEPHRGRRLSSAEFLEATVDSPLHTLFALLGLRGLRRGEALGLRWRNVNLDELELHIEEQLAYHNGCRSLRSTEVEVRSPTRRHRRTALPGCCICTAVDKGSRRRRTAGKWMTTRVCSLTTTAHPLKPVSVTRQFYTLVERHGLRRIRLHDLRHTSASIGLASGETLLEVSRRLGHASLSITADIYSDISPDTAHASAERLAAYLRHQ